MGFIELFALIGMLVVLAYFWSTHNKVVKAENAVEKQFSDLYYLHQSAQSLLNDFIVSIATYGHDEAQAMARYYSMVEKMISEGFGKVILSSPIGIPPTSPPTNLVSLYSTRMQEISRLHERYNIQLQQFTGALSEYKTLRREFPACLIPDALIGSSEQVPKLTDHCIPFIDLHTTQQLIAKQREMLVRTNSVT